jgi:hypothetical protein
MVNDVYANYLKPFCIYGSIQSIYAFQREAHLQQYIKKIWRIKIYTLSQQSMNLIRLLGEKQTK